MHIAATQEGYPWIQMDLKFEISDLRGMIRELSPNLRALRVSVVKRINHGDTEGTEKRKTAESKPGKWARQKISRKWSTKFEEEAQGINHKERKDRKDYCSGKSQAKKDWYSLCINEDRVQAWLYLRKPFKSYNLCKNIRGLRLFCTIVVRIHNEKWWGMNWRKIIN